MRVEFYQSAGEHERYAPHAFDRLIGQDAPFKIGGIERGRATVVKVVVDEDGRGATWTVDIEGAEIERHPLVALTGEGVSFSVLPEIPERWWE